MRMYRSLRAWQGTQEDRPRRIPQMSTAPSDGERTQSGSVKSIIMPDPGMTEPNDGTISKNAACSRFSFDLICLYSIFMFSPPFCLFYSFFTSRVICARLAFCFGW